MSEELSSAEFLRDLANRILRTPPLISGDGYDHNRLVFMAREIENAPKVESRPATFEEILDKAHAAAEIEISKLGPENPNALDCGFAWVCLPGNASFARKCSTKAKKGGSTDRYGSKMSGLGWTFWKPGGFNGQAIGHHEAGSKAFRAVLAKHGIRADFGSRYD